MSKSERVQFVIFHGSLSKNDGNWFPELEISLQDLGQDVIRPQFPIDDYNVLGKISAGYQPVQTLDSWLAYFEKEVLPQLDKKRKQVFIGHSLGNVMILHAVSKFRIALDAAIFVSPFLDRLSLVPWQYDQANSTFYKTDFDFDALVKLIPVSYVLYSDNDPYVEPLHARQFAKLLDSSRIMVKKAGHMNSEVNLNEFPLVLDLCSTRIDLNLYQKYIVRRFKDNKSKFITAASEKYLELTPEEAEDEQRFHFMNLSKGGFAVLPSNSADWDPDGDYFMAGRRSAENGFEITRVIAVKEHKDLERAVLKEQIAKDRKAGIRVLFIDWDQIKSQIPVDDFGIWDDEYVCTIARDGRGNQLLVSIDARPASLEQARGWQQLVISKAKENF
jgi:predicted alpha/beta hydrolase family esterase